MELFARKPLAQLKAEAEGGALKRSLGPWNLTALGIGSIIGTGIFVLTGTAASQNAGPALVISMVIAAVACAFAGLCYAELASMIPVAGSAYTYAYATRRRALRVDHRLGPDSRVRAEHVDGRRRLVGLLREPHARPGLDVPPDLPHRLAPVAIDGGVVQACSTCRRPRSCCW